MDFFMNRITFPKKTNLNGIALKLNSALYNSKAGKKRIQDSDSPRNESYIIITANSAFYLSRPTGIFKFYLSRPAGILTEHQPDSQFQKCRTLAICNV